MRQLVETGYMHNRGRMLVAHFLVKLLMIDWRWGEKFFARNLTDYDIASNNGNWQAIVGGGVYSSPYFRIMKPWIQSAEYDPDAEFIKKWVPELSNVSPRDIHRWNETWQKPENKKVDYPRPMIDYEEQKEKCLDLYKKYL
jgi:deoxyribodipyrimidine photo-lyase